MCSQSKDSRFTFGGNFVRGRLRALILFPQGEKARVRCTAKMGILVFHWAKSIRGRLCVQMLLPQMQNERPLRGQNKNPRFFNRGGSNRTSASQSNRACLFRRGAPGLLHGKPTRVPAAMGKDSRRVLEATALEVATRWRPCPRQGSGTKKARLQNGEASTTCRASQPSMGYHMHA